MNRKDEGKKIYIYTYIYVYIYIKGVVFPILVYYFLLTKVKFRYFLVDLVLMNLSPTSAKVPNSTPGHGGIVLFCLFVCLFVVFFWFIIFFV